MFTTIYRLLICAIGGAKSGFFYAGTCFLSLVWAYFRLPEPKGRTYGELDVLFEQGVPARKFASTVVDPYMTQHARRESVAAQDEKHHAKEAAIHQLEKAETGRS
jgi:SP family general alpha glucoside:H+ symporter-like MFS transporter